LLSHTVSLPSQTLRHRRRPIYNRFVWRAVVVVRRDASSRAPGRLRYRCIGNATSPPGGAGVSGRASAPLGVAGHCVALRRLRGHFAAAPLTVSGTRRAGQLCTCVGSTSVSGPRSGRHSGAVSATCRRPPAAQVVRGKSQRRSEGNSAGHRTERGVDSLTCHALVQTITKSTVPPTASALSTA